MQYIYLHGFASSPNSYKAQFLKSYCHDLGINLRIPDLNRENFSHLTITRQIQQVAEEFRNDLPTTLIGSSLGGLTAVHLAEMYPQVERLVLLAPAFGFLSHWFAKLDRETIHKWQEQKYLSLYHYGHKCELPLHWNFIKDASQYREEELQRPLPTLIWHGRDDEVIPVTASREYASTRPWVKLMEVNSDHGLLERMPEFCLAVGKFCGF